MSESTLLNSTDLQGLQDLYQRLGQTIGELQEREKAKEAKEARNRLVKRLISSLICWPCTGCCFKEGGWKRRVCSLSVALMFYGVVFTVLVATGGIHSSLTILIVIPILVTAIGVLVGVGLCWKEKDCCKKNGSLRNFFLISCPWVFLYSSRPTRTHICSLGKRIVGY